MANEQRVEALRRIEWAAQSGATGLDLSGLGLTELPHEIGKLTNLTELDLWDTAYVPYPRASKETSLI